MRKNKINLKFRDNIQKNYINNSAYKKNKRYVDLALISILKNLEEKSGFDESYSTVDESYVQFFKYGNKRDVISTEDELKNHSLFLKTELKKNFF